MLDKAFSMKMLILAVLFFLSNCTQKKQPASQQPAPPVPIAPAKDTIAPAPPKPPAPPVAEQPPAPPDPDTTEWTELNRLDPTILLDLRYATTNNFVSEKMYDCPRCFLRPEVAKAVLAAHKSLKKKGFGLKMYDCYRPRPIQWKLWNKVHDPDYVADPRQGSMHNRGMAVDLTIVDANGKELDMGTDFDFFGERAYHDFTDLPEVVLKNRELLLETMVANGFRHTRTEWWHYSYVPKTFPLSDWLWDCK